MHYARRRISLPLVSFHRWREPEGYRDLFQILHENSVIPKEHLTTFQNMASFRNMLVHRYEKTDDGLVFGIFRKRLGDFDLFISLVTDWIKKREPSPPPTNEQDGASPSPHKTLKCKT